MRDLSVRQFFFWMAVVLLIGLVFPPAQAQQAYPRDITYCWNLPTEYVDGTLIQPGDLANTRIVSTRQSGEIIIDQLIPVGTLLPGEAQCFDFVGAVPQPGTYTAVAYAITIDDISSDASNSVDKKFTGKPLPPQTFR